MSSSGDFVKRNFARWARQYEASKTDNIEAMDQLMQWLPARMPQNEKTTIVHGDFRLVLRVNSVFFSKKGDSMEFRGGGWVSITGWYE